jgi:hypothetical protein
MSLFGAKTEEERKEQIQRGVVGLAGIGVGAGGAYAATFPLDAMYQKKLTRQAIQSSDKTKEALDHWKVLLQLEKGQLSLEDLPEEDREFYAQELADNSAELKVISRDPYKKKLSLDEMRHGSVSPLFEGVEKAKIRKDFLHKVHHPDTNLLLSAGATIGGIGANYLFDRLSQKENTE